MVYASAGHHPPRVKRCRDGSIFSLDGPRGLPLGIEESEVFEESRATLQVGDQLVLYTDGITEAFSPDGRMFGLTNLDRVLENCCLQAEGLVKAAIDAVDEFTRGAPADDDRTVIVAKIR
jgi:sigma-B regulation protein RsbU (phosphoserine phosphatase)